MLWPDDLAHQVVWGYHWNEPLTSVWSTSLSLIYTISDALSPEAHTHLKPHSTTENTRAHTHNFYVVRKRLSHLSAYFPILLICLIAKRQEGKMSHLNLERRWKRCGVPLKVCLSHHDTHKKAHTHTHMYTLLQCSVLGYMSQWLKGIVVNCNLSTFIPNLTFQLLGLL